MFAILNFDYIFTGNLLYLNSHNIAQYYIFVFFNHEINKGSKEWIGSVQTISRRV